MKVLRPLQALRLSVSPYRLQSRHYWHRFRQAGLRQQRLEVSDASLRVWTPARSDHHTDVPPLLLIQGFGASALWQWFGQVGPLSRGRALFVPDLLGFGGSMLHAGMPSLERQAEAMLALMDHHKISRFDVLGVSYGGFVALRLAERWPERIRRLIIVDSPGYTYDPRDYADLLARFQIDHIADLLLPARPADVRRLLSVAWFDPPWVPELALPDIHTHMFTDQVAEKRALLDDLLARLRAGEAAHFLPPAHRALVIWGEHDTIFPLALGARLAARLGAELRSMARTAHTPNLEDALRFNALVDGFLRAA